MEPAGVSGTLAISDQKSYIIETLRGKNPTEIHGALSEVRGEFTVDRSTVSRWANRFRGGCVSIDNDPRPGRPRTGVFNPRPAALGRALCGPGRVFHKIQCVMNIQA